MSISVTSSPASPARHPLRALFVEDSALDYTLVVRMLETAGYAVQSQRVEDEGAMRAALSASAWDVVISDHNLPDFSSTGALATLKSTGMDIPFLIVSGEIGEDIAVEAMVAGANDYVLKSRLNRLLPALARSLESARVRRREREAAIALLEREERLRSITTNMPGMVFQIRHHMSEGSLSLEYASEGAGRLTGLSAHRLVADGGKAFFAMLPEEDLADLERAFSQAGESLRELRTAEVRWQGRLKAQDGYPLWVALAGSARHTGPELLLWEGVITDITAQKEAESALRELTAHLERAKEDERRNIAREIHDDIGGILTGLKFDLAWLKTRASGDGVTARIDETLRLLASARDASDRIMRNLRPAILEQGIVPALEWQARDFAQRYGIECRFSANRESLDMPETSRMAMFRICQEALTNAAKHAGAHCIDIELFISEDSATLEIHDDGKGLQDADRNKSGSYGLRNMAERAASLGGWLEISSAPGAGTTIMMSLPRESAAPEEE